METTLKIENQLTKKEQQKFTSDKVKGLMKAFSLLEKKKNLSSLNGLKFVKKKKKRSKFR